MNDYPFDQDNPLDLCPGERTMANSALRDYFRLGIKRSYTKLAAAYRKEADEDGKSVPTRHLTTIKRWASRYSWQARVRQQTDKHESILDEEMLDRARTAKENRLRMIGTAKSTLSQSLVILAKKIGYDYERVQAGEVVDAPIEIGDLTNALQSIFTQERLEYNEATSRLAVKDETERMSDDERFRTVMDIVNYSRTRTDQPNGEPEHPVQAQVLG